MAEDIKEPPATQDPGPEPEPTPDGVVEVQGQKLVPLAALTAERERARTTTEERVRKEYEPLKKQAEAHAAQAAQISADLESLQPQIEYLNQHPELLTVAQAAREPSVSDEDAERYARQYELYTATGLDLKRAKHIIADNRSEMAKVARDAAEEAVAPVAYRAAMDTARDNYRWAAGQRTADGSPLVDPSVLANVFAYVMKEDPRILADRAAVQVIMDSVAGQAARVGRPSGEPRREPLFSEAAGGGRRQDYRMSDVERKLARTAGMSDKDFSAQAQKYQPDAVNILGD